MSVNERCGVFGALVPLVTFLACSSNVGPDGGSSASGSIGVGGARSTSSAGGANNGQGGASKSMAQGGSGGTRVDGSLSTSQGGVNPTSAGGNTLTTSTNNASIGGATRTSSDTTSTMHVGMDHGGASSSSTSFGGVQSTTNNSASGGRGGSSTSSSSKGGTSASASTSNGGATGTSNPSRGGVAGSVASSMTMPQAGQSSMHDHCVDGEDADPRDAQLPSKPDRWTSSAGAIDLVEPQAVLDWMTERIWQPSHDAWHNIRRCQGGAITIGAGSAAICSHTELVPDHQECEDAEDGYQFLVMHRHMLQSLKQAFPKHSDLFSGFPHFPNAASDVPTEWQGRWGSGWTQDVKDTAQVLESVENNLTQFATEGDLGRYIQCGKAGSAATSIHGALHFKWVVNESPHSLGKQPVNIENFMFWKLHGWIDDIWERYRKAKGLAPDEDKLKQALTAQCREMHMLGMVVDPNAGSHNNDPLPVEHGFFHEKVRPILEDTCSGCHGDTSPQAGLSLGGHISSADIVKGLVDVPTMYGGQFKRVVAGNPNQSWFYLKPSGQAANAGCSGSSCNTEVMPPTGKVTLTSSELDLIRQWITNGAPAPTQG